MRHLREGFKAVPKDICIQPRLKDSYFSIRILNKIFTLKLQLSSD
jgi:hypothetical protein